MTRVIKSIDVSGVNLDIYEGPVGVSCSGGADSSILLYNLMKHCEDKIYIFSTGNNQRSRHNVEVATKVVERCIQLTGNSNIEHHISYCEVQSSETLFPKLRPYIDNGVIKMLYTGITENPPTNISDNFKLKITETKRNPGVIKPFIVNGVAYTPWTNVDKRSIAKMYNEENLLEDLYSITRSCEYDPTSDYFEKIEDPGLGHCGECWWCEERKWAFGRLE